MHGGPNVRAPILRPRIPLAVSYFVQGVFLYVFVWSFFSPLVFLACTLYHGPHLCMGCLTQDLRGERGCVRRLSRMPFSLLLVPFNILVGLLFAFYFVMESWFLPFTNLVCALAGCWSSGDGSSGDGGKVRPDADVELAENPPDAQGRRRRRLSDEAREEAIKRYVDHESVWEVLKRNDDVRLIRLSWLQKKASEPDFVLARRQDLPEEAFIGYEELREIERSAKSRWVPIYGFNKKYEESYNGEGSPLLKLLKIYAAVFYFERNIDRLLPIVSISYCWLEPSHPDRAGEQLRLLFAKLRKLYGRHGLLGACQAYGFRDMGVFWDWASLHQKDPDLWGSPDLYESSRKPDHTAAMKRALNETMDLWCARSNLICLASALHVP